MNLTIPISAFLHLPLAEVVASKRFQDTLATFFKAIVRNANTRRAYETGAKDFFVYLSSFPHVGTLEAIIPSHIGDWLDDMLVRGLALPTVKQRLAGIRRMFDKLVYDRVLIVSPATVVKGPGYSVEKGKTPVLTGEQTVQLLDAIDVTQLIGLRDRAMISAMAYSFARISAITHLQVKHVFRQQRRTWLRLAEKGGKSHDVPCHPRLEDDLLAWLEAAGHANDPDAWVFQTFTWEPKPKVNDDAADAVDDAGECATADGPAESGLDNKRKRPRRRILSGEPMSQSMTWDMLQRRAAAADIDTAVCNHTFRATGITAYLSHGGTIERAARIAGHRSTRTTQLYDRRSDDVLIDEINKVIFA
jgi:integrase/recombinase XerC